MRWGAIAARQASSSDETVVAFLRLEEVLPVAKAHITYLSEEEKEFVHAKTLEVLERVGVAYNTPKAIDLLAAAGVRVDREALTARLTWDVIEAALRTVPPTVLLAGRDPSRDCLLGDGRLIATSDGMTGGMVDDVGGGRRDGTVADLADPVSLRLEIAYDLELVLRQKPATGLDPEGLSDCLSGEPVVARKHDRLGDERPAVVEHPWRTGAVADTRLAGLRVTKMADQDYAPRQGA